MHFRHSPFRQHKTKDKAFGVLRSRLYEQELAKKQADDATKRTSQVSSGDRSAKIRTYNYAQGRVTDHRVGLTLYDLGNIMNGDIQKIVDAYIKRENVDKFTHIADFAEIEENDFNLNIPRYVDTFEEEEPIDIVELSKEMKNIE